MVPLGIGSAAAVRVGHAIGRRDISSAVIAGWAAMLLGGLFMFSAGLVFIAMPEPLASVFTNQTRVIEATTALLAIAALFQLFDGLQAVATGALRGAGNTHTAAISHLICYWAVGLPSGYFLCFHMGWGAAGMWAGLCLALILIGLVLTAAWVAQTRQLARDN
jgi:MATE family multidrug resistance protein